MTDTAGSARRLESYTRVSVYLVFAALPLAYQGAFPAAGTAVGLGIGLLQAAASVLVCRQSLTMLRQGRRKLTTRQAWLFGAWLLGSAVVLLLVCLQVNPGQPWFPAVCAAAAVPLMTVSALLRTQIVIGASLLLGALLGVVAAARASLPTSEAVGFALAATLLLACLGMSMWLTGWMLRNIWELDRARRTAAELAVAEERLRIARDLHDLFGRTLATVAVKTELAGELVRREQPEAALVQLGEVRAIAEQTGQQVRSVVQGYRADDLATELAGARSLLDSAGIRCTVRGAAPDRLAPSTVSTLVWVLREAVTNVIRHSSARECMITIEDGDQVRMIITNDGARPGGDHDHHGHGLIGMQERLTAIDGTLHASSVDSASRFTVEVGVPRTVGPRS